MTPRIAVATCLGDLQGVALLGSSTSPPFVAPGLERCTLQNKLRQFAHSVLSSPQAAACTTIDDWPKDVSCAGVSFPVLGLIVFPYLLDQSSLNLSICLVGPVSCDVSHTGKVFVYLLGQTRTYKHVKFPSGQLALNAGWCAPLANSQLISERAVGGWTLQGNNCLAATLSTEADSTFFRIFGPVQPEGLLLFCCPLEIGRETPGANYMSTARVSHDVCSANSTTSIGFPIANIGLPFNVGSESCQALRRPRMQGLLNFTTMWEVLFACMWCSSSVVPLPVPRLRQRISIIGLHRLSRAASSCS